MHYVQVATKDGGTVDIYLDTPVLDTLVADWKNKVSKPTRYKGENWEVNGSTAYLFVIPNTIAYIFVVE